MVKSYLKYKQSRTFGLVTSISSNVVWTADSTKRGAGRAVAAANEEVLTWDIKKGELLSRWKDPKCKHQVTAIAQSKTDPDLFAVGYEDGSIRLWDSKIVTIIIGFNGHKSAITTLVFDKPGVRLASGSRDTDLIVWDLVQERGEFLLRGHKDQITGLQFLEPQAAAGDDGSSALGSMGTSDGFLLSTSKDSLIKIWDLGSRHCIETHVAQTNGECWALGLMPDSGGCITAGNNGELKVWSIDTAGLYSFSKKVNGSGECRLLQDRGVIHRHGKDKALEVSFHPRQDYFAVHGSERAIEIWRMRSEEEVKKSLARKRKRRREKQGQKGEDDAMELDGKPDDISSAEITDFFDSHVIVRTTGKVRSAEWMVTKGSKAVQILAATNDNQLEVYTVATKDKSKKINNDEAPQYSKSLSVDLPGHRSDIRSLALSIDDRMLASASNGGLKIWNIRTKSCIRTFECGYALCCAFLPGDKLVVIGTKSGDLELFDVAAATMIDTVKAHEGAVWSLQVHPDGRSLLSGSADQFAKFWDFKIVDEDIPGTKRTTKRLRLVPGKQALKVSDQILSVRFSPDSKLLAVALLDNTVKVFFVDSLKLFLNLYGHKLPVLSMDISFDSKKIVTCSADKQIRLWGLDFGDCQKAFNGHCDSILQVVFVPHNQDGNGHHFFSASKDKMIRYWDGDKFEQIQRLDGHHNEIWALAVSRTGNFIVSASFDKSIRVWEQTDEQIFLEEERDKELEELYESTLTTSLEQDRGNDEEVLDPGKQTVETLMAGEKIAEALEIGLADLEIMREWEIAKETQPNTAPPARNPLFMALGGISAEAHVIGVLQRIQAAALQDALLVLSFSVVPSLFIFLDIFATRSMNIPLTCRILFFIMKIHHRQLVSSKIMRPMLNDIKVHLRQSLNKHKHEMGFNLAALRIISARVKESAVKNYVDETWENKEENTRKRGFVQVA
ncbi:WD40-repeat-containing domain protein [Calycina marina]|uniref:WD40-repeat-containing domain protein n=1 Tax=Calycina marina TaxID=1763456 RepID=A0A9P8CDF4_9HELO|nr:WD40-repeat-containing domain protein [Calycina marina]